MTDFFDLAFGKIMANGVPLELRKSLNFGAGLSVTPSESDPTVHEVACTVASLIEPGINEIQSGGTPLEFRTALNFGAGLSVTPSESDPTAHDVACTITSSTARSTIKLWYGEYSGTPASSFGVSPMAPVPFALTTSTGVYDGEFTASGSTSSVTYSGEDGVALIYGKIGVRSLLDSSPIVHGAIMVNGNPISPRSSVNMRDAANILQHSLHMFCMIPVTEGDVISVGVLTDPYGWVFYFDTSALAIAVLESPA